MDINFHYFSVKVIAHLAGYNNTDADKIATFSQYVDDHFDNKPISIKGDHPSFANILFSEGNICTPVKTGITIFASMTELEQRDVVVPFHFIPDTQCSTAAAPPITNPAAWNHGTPNTMIGLWIQQLLTHRAHPEFLMFLGMLLHIFADTYAHQSFSGLNHNINKGRVHHAFMHLPGQSEKTKTYFGYEGLPAIGHARYGTAPDETALTYSCYRTNASGAEYSVGKRCNKDVFLVCAEEIYAILCAANGRTAPTQLEIDDMKALLSIGFQTDYHKNKEIPLLAEHWYQIMGETISFAYDAKDVRLFFFGLNTELLPHGMSEKRAQELLSFDEAHLKNDQASIQERELLLASKAVTPTNAYYYYNRCAYDIRTQVNG